MIALLLAVCMTTLTFTACEGSDSADQPTGIPPTVARSSTRAPAASHRIDVDYISQREDYPCGCESVSAVMALRYAGYEYDVDSFIDRFLPTGADPYYENDGLLHAESPYDVFIGSPYSDYSYGCYAPVIRVALEAALSDAYGGDEINAESGSIPVSVRDLTGASLESLCRDYIDRDIPVIVWGTIGMQPIRALTEWVLPDGSLFTWKSQEHCLLLVGYDASYYYFNDPMEGKDTAYPKADAENAYSELYSQAIAIVPNA